MNIKSILSDSNPVSNVTFKNQNNRLSDGYFAHLNPSACQNVNPCSKTFWQDLTDWLTPMSKSAADYPKNIGYRKQLAPYILQRVNLIAKGWRINSARSHGDAVWLTLTDVRLALVPGTNAAEQPKGFAKHMNIKVSAALIKRLNLDPAGELSIHGTLYEYVNSKNKRNIAVWPVALYPRRRRKRPAPEPASYQKFEVSCR